MAFAIQLQAIHTAQYTVPESGVVVIVMPMVDQALQYRKLCGRGV